MKLINEALLARCASIGSQKEESDPLVLVKFFNPCGRGTWLLTEYFPKIHTAYGYVFGLFPGCDEWGYYSLDELEALQCPPLGLPIERDTQFIECRFSELKAKEVL